MSWNISTRLNNLQYQINGKLANPLTTDLDCDNNSIVDCKTLHYQQLDPPVSVATETIEQILQTGDDANGENIQNVGTLSLAQQNFLDTDLVNQDIVIRQLSGLGGRLNVYQASDTISPFNSSATLAVGNILTTANISCNGTATIAGACNVGTVASPSNLFVDGNIRLNQDGIPNGECLLSTDANGTLLVNNTGASGGIQCGNLTTGAILTSGKHFLYPLDAFKYITLQSKSVGALGTGTLQITSNSPIPTASGNLECNQINSGDIISTGNITCNQLNYTTLNPPIAGTTPTLSQVLTVGNNAGGSNITNIGALFTGSLQGTGTNGTFQIGNNPLNTYTNDDGAGEPQLSLGFCNLNMGGNQITNLPTPTSSDEPATKGYVDSNIPVSGTTYISGTPYAINVSIPNSGASTLIYNSQAFSKPSGKSVVINITFNNINILSGSNNTNLITGVVQFSQDNSTWTNSSIDPYGSGFLFSPAFSAFVSIPTAWTTYYFRILGSQTNVSVPSYNLTANLMLVSFQS
jgi:hypothetical protein